MFCFKLVAMSEKLERERNNGLDTSLQALGELLIVGTVGGGTLVAVLLGGFGRELV